MIINLISGVTSYPRIISTVPSITELIADLGCRDRLIGITKFCIHPADVYRKKPRIGGTKNLNIEKIKSLNPDLIIANKEENDREQIFALAQDYDVYVSEVGNQHQAMTMIQDIAQLTQSTKQADLLEKEIIKQKKILINKVYKLPSLSCAYIIWQDPYMTVGGDTFISDMMSVAGIHNIYADQDRYPIIEISDLKNKKPDIVCLSSEPYPFMQHHADQLKNELPESHIITVDGELFSWYGSRMTRAYPYLYNLRRQISYSIL